jgi:calcium-dependent protein kinase
LFDRVVREGHLSERRAAAVMRAVLTMVAECHLAGVIHRDIKVNTSLYACCIMIAPR